MIGEYQTSNSFPNSMACPVVSKGSYLTIDLAAIADNFQILKDKAEPAEVAGVVKADCYGLGMGRIAPVLKEAGCRTWFVATPEEGFALRRIIGKKGMIAVLGGMPAALREEFNESDLTAVLNTPEDIGLWSSGSTSRPAILHFDTGMNRLGFGETETGKLLSSGLLKKCSVYAVMSHFACADEPEKSLTGLQFERFREIAGHFPEARKSLANSAGLFASKDYHFDLVRPGYALYGGTPRPGFEEAMRPVASLHARILQTRLARKGETVGYGATYKLENDSMLATVGLGYADGFFRCLSGCGKMYWQGIACPVVGRVSMDLTVVDISALPDRPDAGDFMEVLGTSQSIEDLAKMAGTIGYEVLTSLGKRYERRYIT